MTSPHGRFVWYELLTTDAAAAESFYADVMGWRVQDVSAPGMTYALFIAGQTSVCGIMGMPEEAKRSGAKPRWMGYVAVDDVDAAAVRVKELGGSLRLPPTDIPGISRFAIVADPQAAGLALFKGAGANRQQPVEPGQPGHVGWHELLAADWPAAFAFYSALFDWQKAETDTGARGSYQTFAVDGKMIGGMFNKPPMVPTPYWLFYFNVADMDVATERVKAGGGAILDGPLEGLAGSWIARCADPQGAMFALEGPRSGNRISSETRADARTGRWHWWVSRD